MFIMYRFLVQNTDPWGQRSERDGLSVTKGGGSFLFFSFFFSPLASAGSSVSVRLHYRPVAAWLFLSSCNCIRGNMDFGFRTAAVQHSAQG